MAIFVLNLFLGWTGINLELDSVSDVDVRLREGKVIVRHDADRASVETLLGALGAEGYEGRPGDDEPSCAAASTT